MPKPESPQVTAEKAHASFEKLREELEAIRKRFVRYLVRMAVTRAEAEAQQAVESQLANTESMTDAQLLWLKRAIRDFPKSHRKEIETACSSPQVWWHLRSEDGLKGLSSFHVNKGYEGRPDQIGEYTAEGPFFQMAAAVFQLHRSFLYKLGYRLDPYRAPSWPKLAVTIAALYDKTQRKAEHQYGIYHRHRAVARQRAVQKRWRSIKA